MISGGILPVQLSDSADLSFNSTALVTANMKPFPPSRQGFNFSMVQQALTVLTECESLRLDANTNPPLQRLSESVEITVNGQLTPYTAVGIETIRNGVTSRAGESFGLLLVCIPDNQAQMKAFCPVQIIRYCLTAVQNLTPIMTMCTTVGSLQYSLAAMLIISR
jgi:hypothetical protein